LLLYIWNRLAHFQVPLTRPARAMPVANKLLNNFYY
jgi:hypothetical protein